MIRIHSYIDKKAFFLAAQYLYSEFLYLDADHDENHQSDFIGEYIFRLSKESLDELSWAGGLAWLRYRLDMAGVVGSNPTRPILITTLKCGPLTMRIE